MRKEYRLRSKRLASFREYSITVSSARSKKTKIVNAAWPHPPTSKLTPESLADAGFFFNPDDDAPDKTECFICGLSLANWEEDDEPRTEHLKRSNSCTWTEAQTRCWFLFPDANVLYGLSASWRFNSDDRVPTHPARIKARLETFASWPHDKKKGHNCTSEALAQAGFVHVPDVGDGEDMVVCDYCNRSLNGWGQMISRCL
ncbi:uncharacterized protein EI90DRAFT_2934856 [Cantharellus anzutake]|uniref:uncharacterized protein n=1 Tax=Cantharellus anzutake TaxID=1750568 RepID=UPI0019084E65|nr:uncharacterized protein EI90DRAFT_2934856 [Cantharellus anzutake]KAF8324343.1 hypothetical protein EI90DRAFT_2934856 [Cantharellus anzutake]